MCAKWKLMKKRWNSPLKYAGFIFQQLREIILTYPVYVLMC